MINSDIFVIQNLDLSKTCSFKYYLMKRNVSNETVYSLSNL